MKKMIISLVLIAISQFSFAETCPTVAEIKKSSLKGWKAYDSDDGTLLSAARRAAFIKDIEAFALAEWAEKDRKTNTIHCYYRDHEGSALEAYIAKDNFIPSINKYWYQVSGSKQCAAGMDKCKFSRNALLRQQLATK